MLVAGVWYLSRRCYFFLLTKSSQRMITRWVNVRACAVSLSSDTLRRLGDAPSASFDVRFPQLFFSSAPLLSTTALDQRQQSNVGKDKK